MFEPSMMAASMSATSWKMRWSVPSSRLISGILRPWATSSCRDGMLIPYTCGKRTGGAAEVKVTLLAPASRAICTISLEVVPRTIESSTIRMFLPLNSLPIAFSFCFTLFLRSAWPGMMKVRPT